MRRTQVLFGSITDLTPHERGGHAVVGSHGGRQTGAFAARIGLASLLCHDAGIGLDEAGVAGLTLLEAAGVPAAAVSHLSARIGDPEDMLARGRLSRLNAGAAAAGLKPGMPAALAQRLLQALPAGEARPVEPGAGFLRRLLAQPLGIAVTALDSASQMEAADAGAILVTGSHGGLPANDRGRAAKAAARLLVFNDAGVGIERAGVARLAVLDAEGIAAVCVDAMTAHIGSALSTWQRGRLSVVNRRAAAAGLAPGQSVGTAIRRLLDLDRQDASPLRTGPT